MQTSYDRRLGLFDGTMLVIGGIIGAGIFLNPGSPNVPASSIADISFAEGETPAAPRRSSRFSSRGRRSRPVTVSFEIVDGTAQHGNDFEVDGGTLVIAAGRTSGRIAVAVKGDIVPEGDVFSLRLIGATNGTIEDGKAQATIVDVDTTPPGPPGG